MDRLDEHGISILDDVALEQLAERERISLLEAKHWVLVYRAAAYPERSPQAEAYIIAAARVLDGV